MFEVLRREELDSLKNGQFGLAEEAKVKYNRLREKQARMRQEMVLVRNKENMREAEKQG